MLDADEAGKTARLPQRQPLSILAVQIVELASGAQPDQLASEKSINSWQALIMTFQLQTDKDPCNSAYYRSQ